MGGEGWGRRKRDYGRQEGIRMRRVRRGVVVPAVQFVSQRDYVM